MFKNGIKHALQSFLKYSKRLSEERKKNLLAVRADMLLEIAKGVTPAEYYTFGFDILPRSARGELLTVSRSRKASRVLNDSHSQNILENKYYASAVISRYYARECVQSINLSFEEFQAFVRKAPKFVYKPVGTNGGDGLAVYDVTKSSPEEIYQIIQASPRGILEQWIVQHAEMNRLSSRAVHTVRIHTIHDGNTDNIVTFGTVLTVAPEGELANPHFHATITMLVNGETGTVYTNAVDKESNLVYDRFPGTDIPVVGFQLPDWEKALALVKAAASTVPEIRYIGWDVAFSENGPVICEGNCRSIGVMNRQSHLYGEHAYTEGGWKIISSYMKKAGG